MSIGNNIRGKRIELGYTLEDVAKRLKTSRQTVHRYETGVISNIPSDKVEMLADVLEVTPAFLMGWEEKTQHPIMQDDFFPISKKKLPLLERIACGEPVFAEEEFDHYVKIKGELRADFAIRVKGDSMAGAFIRDGDVVFIRRQNSVEQGEIAAVLRDDNVILKRYFRYGDMVILRPDNSAYNDIVIKEGEAGDVKIIGKAVAFQSKIR